MRIVGNSLNALTARSGRVILDHGLDMVAPDALASLLGPAGTFLCKRGPYASVEVLNSFMMTKEGTFTMISRVVVVRHLGGMLCAVGPMVSLLNLSSLHPWGS